MRDNGKFGKQRPNQEIQQMLDKAQDMKKTLVKQRQFCNPGTNDDFSNYDSNVSVSNVSATIIKHEEFELIDPRNPCFTTSIKVPVSSNLKLEGQHKRRENQTQGRYTYDSVYSIVKESAMLSLVGKIVYDSQSDSVTLNDSLLITSLSFSECVSNLRQSEVACRWAAICSGLVGASLFTILGATYFGLRRANKRKEQAKLKNQDVLQRSLSKLDVCATQCVICMNVAASVVTTPCNHLAMCQECLFELKKTRHGDECPICKHHFEDKDVFYLNVAK